MQKRGLDSDLKDSLKFRSYVASVLFYFLIGEAQSEWPTSCLASLGCRSVWRYFSAASIANEEQGASGLATVRLG